MAVVKTVKPGGGGDFTSLQGWWDWAKTQADAAQWAECYGGGSLGMLNTSGGTTFTADASNYPRVFAAPGHHHELAWDTAKAHIDEVNDSDPPVVVVVDFMRVEGLAIRLDAGGVRMPCVVVTESSDVRFSDLLCIGVDLGNLVIGIYGPASNDHGPTTIINCVTYNCGAAGILSGDDEAVEIYNCGSINCGGYWAHPASAGISINHFGGSGVVVKNCYALNTGGAPCFHSSIGITAENLCSSDGSADDFGGSGHQTGVSTSGQVVDIEADWRTVSGSDFAGAGVDLSVLFTTDVMGEIRSVPWWVGAWQEGAGGVGGFKALWVIGSNQILGRN